MKILKKVIIMLLLVIVTGCGNKELDTLYDKMHSGEEGINGYSIDLRVYGVVSEKAINEIIRVSNYKDEDFRVTIVNKNIALSPLDEKSTEEDSDTVFYVMDGKTYTNETGTYKETSEKQDYDNPLIYLEGLKNVSDVTSKSEETIGENKYKVYNLKVKKDFAETILDEVGIEIKNLNGNIEAKVYENAEGYVYRIIYYIGALTVNVNYFGINNSAEIIMPQ